MRRLGTAAGALPETFSGLSGMGDLTVTCFPGKAATEHWVIASHVVNRWKPYWHPRYRRLSDIASAKALAARLEVSTPIIDEVYAMLYEGKTSIRR